VREIRGLLLCAGLGTRLDPLTQHCPKCLVPVGGIPLLEHWLCLLKECELSEVWINIHHHRDLVEQFIRRESFRDWVNGVFEKDLLGTAGTLRENARTFLDCTTFFAHADNWCICDLSEFIRYHLFERPANTSMTMMTFRTNTPESCGIVSINDHGVVYDFQEKVAKPKGNLANGAVYLIEPEVVEWVKSHHGSTDFSTEVIPHFLGQIATWENTGTHRDIGVVDSLLEAQSDGIPETCLGRGESWHEIYEANPIHDQLASLLSIRNG